MSDVFYTDSAHTLRFKHSYGTFAQAAACNNLRCSEPIMKGKPTVTNTMNSYRVFFSNKITNVVYTATESKDMYADAP